MKRVENRIISSSMYDLAQTIQSDDGVASAACNQAALRLDEQHMALLEIRNAASISKMRRIAIQATTFDD